MALTDKTFLQDYNPRLSRYTATDPFLTGTSEGISQLYLTGKGNRSYFDVRSIYYLWLLDGGCAKSDPGHPSGARLHLHLRPSGARRRTRLRYQFHQPDAPVREFRRRSPERAQQRHLLRRPPIPRSKTSASCVLAWRARHLQPFLGRDQMAAQLHRFDSARCSRRSPRCAPMPARCRSNPIPGVSNFINTGDTRSRARHADCRPGIPLSRSSTRSPGARRRWSRSRR